MIGWVAYWCWQAFWRVVVSGACLFTIGCILTRAGYRVDYPAMLVVAICLIIGVRIWMPSPSKDQNNHADT